MDVGAAAMILFDLKCSQDHRFEGWFRNGVAYDAQAAAQAITCPICGDSHIDKAPMAPSIGRSGRSREVEPVAQASAPAAADVPAMPDSPDMAAQAAILRHLRDLRTQVEKSAENVGQNFAEEARKIHYGEVQSRAIYGETSVEQAEALRDEGVPIARIPWIPNSN